MRLENDWARVREAFERASALPAGARGPVLGALDDRADLRAEVERLLRFGDSGAGPLDAGARELLERADAAAPAGAFASAADAAAGELAGRRIGDLHVLAPLSSGGMGDVYLAERSIGAARRRVALKVLKRGLDTDALLRRFRREQETLAGLQHEHVVAFLDAGALPDGRPFLVMEHVDGVPLAEHCAARDLDVPARLDLLLQACDAVQAAHARLVLHCDLKPGNILVTGSGCVKLLDFGIARLLRPDGDARDATDAAAVPVTPAYASPEQLRRERLTVATDVWGLGLVLHEVLAGRPAFDAASVFPPRAAAAPLPSGAAQGPLARAPAALRRDLDAIVARCLREEPASRYASVDALAADLRRCLRGEPVSARRGGRLEALQRLLRRHRVASFAALVLLLVLGALLAGTWLGKRRAEREASTGWGAHAAARQAAAVLEDLLVGGAEVGTLLARADERLSGELSERPEAEALVRLALGRLLLERGRPELALEHLARALALTSTTRGLGPADRARALRLLGSAQLAAGHPDALDTLQRALAGHLALAAPDEDAVAALRAQIEEARRTAGG